MPVFSEYGQKLVALPVYGNNLSANDRSVSQKCRSGIANSRCICHLQPGGEQHLNAAMENEAGKAEIRLLPDSIFGLFCAPWPCGGVVTQRIANPCTPVRFRAGPPFFYIIAQACCFTPSLPQGILTQLIRVIGENHAL
jgi:hypothetical protein